jgi:hypothetical protein
MAGVNAYETGTVIFGEGLLGLVPPLEPMSE